MEKDRFVRATTDEYEAYKKINSMKRKFGTFHKCIFHLHTPASYDYKLLKEYKDENHYQKCNDKDMYELCIKHYVFPLGMDIDVFKNKEEFPCYTSVKECLTYLLIAQKLIDNKIELVVITDHNTIRGYKLLKFAIEKIKKSKPNGVYPQIILGVEISCADKNHVVGIFNGYEKEILDIESWFEENILSEKDGTFLTSYDVIQNINNLKGIPYVAHIDTSNTFGDKYLNGAYKKKLFELPCFKVIGISDKSKLELMKSYINDITKREFCFILDEDSHAIEEIGTKATWIKGSKCDFSMIFSGLRDFSIALEYEKPREPDNYIKGIFIKGSASSFLRGKNNNDFCLSFSESLNCIIGGRGTGKSTVLQLIEFLLRQHCDNEKILDFICKHEEIWVLFVNDKKEYMIRFYAPEKEYYDDQIMKYFTDDRNHRYGWKYYFDKEQVEKYTLLKYITIDKVEARGDFLYAEKIADKKSYLEKFFNVRYSVNELVRTAGSDEINSYIYKTMFRNNTLANASQIVGIRSKNGLKRLLEDIQGLMSKRFDEVSSVIDAFNIQQNGLLRIAYSQKNEVEPIDFAEIINNINGKQKYYKKKNIEQETVIDYLLELNNRVGIQRLLLCAFDKKYDEINKVMPISNMLLERNQNLIEKGISFVNKESEILLIGSIMEDVLNEKNIDLVIKYLKDYVEEIESFDLEFNLNSKESNKNQSLLYRNVKYLSLGQKVVAMLSFVLGFSDFSKDYTPLIIDQPEDNLDNQYIYKNLVKQLRDIKSKRQVIIATHNATIVTNAKAEQVVIMESDYTKGWIETTGYPNEKKIKKHIINYLEGGIESFQHKCFVYDDVINAN
ncbi:MAG: Spaf_1101 family AAA-like ATPase [Mobilitalea sp.]